MLNACATERASRLGYGANAEAFEAGYAASGGDVPNDHHERFIAAAGPDRLAYQAGWIQRQKDEKVERLARPKLRVRVVLDVEVDREAYDEWFAGPPSSAADIREHIKTEAASAFESAFAPMADAVKVQGWK